MTNSYNTTVIQMVKYIKDELSPHEITNDNETCTVYSLSKDNTKNYLYGKDLYVFVKLFKAVLGVEFPRFNKLNQYIRSIVKI